MLLWLDVFYQNVQKTQALYLKKQQLIDDHLPVLGRLREMKNELSELLTVYQLAKQRK